MLGIFFAVLQQAQTSVTIDWGMIATAVAPIITIIVTWYLQRRTTKAAAAELAEAHNVDKEEAARKREQDKQELLSGQQDIAGIVNAQLMLLANGRIKALKQKIKDAGGTVNGETAVDIVTAAEVIDELENQLNYLLNKNRTTPKKKPRIK